MVKVGILFLFLTLGENFQSFTIKYDVSCGFFISALYRNEEFPFYSSGYLNTWWEQSEINSQIYMKALGKLFFSPPIIMGNFITKDFQSRNQALIMARGLKKNNNLRENYVSWRHGNELNPWKKFWFWKFCILRERPVLHSGPQTSLPSIAKHKLYAKNPAKSSG